MVLYRRLEYGRWARNHPECLGALEGVVVGKQCDIHAIAPMKGMLMPVLDVVELLSIWYIDDLQSSDAFDLDIDIGG